MHVIAGEYHWNSRWVLLKNGIWIVLSEAGYVSNL